MISKYTFDSFFVLTSVPNIIIYNSKIPMLYFVIYLLLSIKTICRLFDDFTIAMILLLLTLQFILTDINSLNFPIHTIIVSMTNYLCALT